jgi:hypothetical protein
MSPLEAIEKEAEGISQSLILCAHTHIARAVRLATDAWWSIPAASAFPAFPTTFRSRMSSKRHARRALRESSNSPMAPGASRFRHVPV